MNDQEKLYIDKSKSYIDFMLSQQQWSGLTKPDIDLWLSNFKDLQPKELLLVYKLLANLIYFSEKDVIEALKEGIHNCLVYDVVLKKQIENKFALSQHALLNLRNEELKKTCFIPLLDSNSPHESGNYVSRLLVQQGLISPSQSLFLDNLPSSVELNHFSRIVVVDDCVGSGDQLSDFWDFTTISDNGHDILLSDFCQNNGIQANYLTLFGYEKSVQALTKNYPQLNITCVRNLSDKQKVFSNNSYIWINSDEKEKALSLFMELTNNIGIPLYGYKQLDFAFIMHQTIPDWSLPIFWKENSDWHLLMRRKNSND